MAYNGVEAGLHAQGWNHIHYYQADDNATKLDHISVSHRVQASHPRVEDGNQSADYDGQVQLQSQNDCQRGAFIKKN